MRLHLKQGNLDKALQCAQESVDFSRKYNLHFYVLMGLYWTGNFLLASGEMVTAEKAWQDLLKYPVSHEVPLQQAAAIQAAANNGLAKLARDRDELDKAQEYTDIANRLWESVAEGDEDPDEVIREWQAALGMIDT